MIEAKALQRGHALSRATQPALEQLYKALGSDEAVTIVVGAGFSMDAGLPGWRQLIERLANGLGSVNGIDMGKLVMSDEDDLTRKAEYLIQMRLKQASYGSTEELIRSALYQDSSFVSPGPLLRALTSLVGTLRGRVSILTTNFDEMLEISFAEHRRGFKADPVVGVPVLIEQHDEWSSLASDLQAQGKVPIFHLHGRVGRIGQENLDSVVLTQSHFLRHGPKVRRVIEQALNTTTTIFLGLSMSDPNLLGPLWDTRNRSKPAFVVSALSGEGGVDQGTRWGYAIEKSEYLETQLQASMIFLKTYGQLEQFLHEARLATVQPSRHSLPANREDSLAYGARLSRNLVAAHDNIGCRPGRNVPLGAKSEELRLRLERWIVAPSPLSEFLKKVLSDDDVLARQTSLDHKWEAARSQKEWFSLQLWLRPRVSDRSNRKYEVGLVGASNVTYHQPSARTMPSALIDSNSENMAARAIARGRAMMWSPPLAPHQGSLRWRGTFAAPIRLLEQVEVKSTTVMVPISLGAVCLMSTKHIVTAKEGPEPGVQISVISAMDGGQRAELAFLLTQIGQELISQPPK